MPTTAPETKYKVQSLERGLSLLRELRAANAPMRNHDFVSRTGLPKATVSRLLNTLGVLGYVRRIDEGSYVLANASTRTGRALLGALGLERCRAFVAEAPGPVYLEALVGPEWVPVYRWSRQGAAAVANASPLLVAAAGRRPDVGDGELWDAASATWWAWTRLHIEGVGAFTLTLQHARPAPPARTEAAEARALLQRAAQALGTAREQ